VTFLNGTDVPRDSRGYQRLAPLRYHAGDERRVRTNPPDERRVEPMLKAETEEEESRRIRDDTAFVARESVCAEHR